MSTQGYEEELRSERSYVAELYARLDAERTRVKGAYNAARAVFSEIVTWVLTERAIARIGRGWLTRADREAWERLRADLLCAEDLADRFVERDTRELVERAAADRDWTYRHVVVDETQKLSEMD